MNGVSAIGEEHCPFALVSIPGLALCIGAIDEQEIAAFIAERDGHPARADHIYLTNGASEGDKPIEL